MKKIMLKKIIKPALNPQEFTELDLIPYKSRSNTWVSGTLRWQKRYNCGIEQGATRISIDARNVRNDISRISLWLKTHQMQNSSNWICLQLLYPELRIGLNMIGKIRTGSYWTTERLAKSQLIAKLYREKCPCCNANVPENIEHILLGCSRWAAIPFNPQEFTGVSSMHLLDDSNPKTLKKACYAIDYVAFKIDDKYVSYQHYTIAKAIYFMFYNEERAEKCMNMPIYYNGIAAELYQTVTLEEGTQIITIPNTNGLNIIKLVEAVNKIFTKNGIIYDFSAYKNKRSGKFHTFGMKFLFKKIINSFEIPTFLEIDNFVLALNYMGCKPVCSFCKHQEHWKSDCPELKKFKQNKPKNKIKVSKSTPKIS
ncbi:hypothetical protein BB561_004904 [Smittium simulii]|uniref:CCHC-type domain-containing protein n=1 Tax=Smittium simulii TaxID=133385 RepID=A0A2T9YDM2_9FUNG|nr:hypothetical protein BB561_004904 [Smittium simulii]